VDQFEGDRYAKTFKAWNQLTVLLFAQASGKNSLRDIQNAFAAQSGQAYHLGLPDSIAKSTLADCNARVPWQIYQNLFTLLQKRCQSLAPRHSFRFKNPLFSIDSTVIELSLEAFPWAKYARQQGAIKLHYGLDHSGNIPTFLNITDNQTSDINVARDHWPIIPDSINCFDKGYIDFAWFRRVADGGAYFVTRAKTNMVYRVIGQQELPKNKSILSDETIALTGYASAKKFPGALRLIRYFDAENKREFAFLTNNFKLAAATIAKIYKGRWQIEAFFKWIKQNLRIKSFLGTSPRAVLTQVWLAMCYFLMLAYVKFQAKSSFSLFYLHRIIGQTILTRLLILDLMHLNAKRLARLAYRDPQLCLQL
jgi:hypothetical protein